MTMKIKYLGILFIMTLIIITTGCVNTNNPGNFSKNLTNISNNASVHKNYSYQNPSNLEIYIPFKTKSKTVKIIKSDDIYFRDIKNNKITIKRKYLCQNESPNETIFIIFQNDSIKFNISSICSSNGTITIYKNKNIKIHHNLSYKYIVIDNRTNCLLDGTLSYCNESYNGFNFVDIGNVTNGIIILNKPLRNNSDICISAKLSKCFGYYKNFELFREYKNKNGNIIYFDIDPQHIKFLADYENFVRPNDVKYYVDKNKKYITQEDINKKLEKWFDIVYRDIRYRWDFGNDWKPPQKTLEDNSGDCEEFATTFLSVIKSYNSSLKCFNIIVPSHLTTICKFEKANVNTFEIFDIGDTFEKISFYNYEPIDHKELKLYHLMNEYFYKYGLKENNNQFAYYAFNETDVFYFDSNKEFFDWLINL